MKMTFTLEDYDFLLPTDRIAQTGAEPRDSSKLLVAPRHASKFEHRVFTDIAALSSYLLSPKQVPALPAEVVKNLQFVAEI